MNLELFRIGFLPISLLDILDIALVSWLFFTLYRYFRNTRAGQMLVGLVILLVVTSVARVLNMSALSWLMRQVQTVWVVAFVILFQPELRRMLLLPPAGEPRAAYLYPRTGQAEAVQDYVAEHLADRFILVETERALAAGLFGPGKPSPETRSRLGDLLLLAQNDSRLLEKEEKYPLHGHHGSLTAEEMMVPAVMVRLDRVS